MVMADRLWFLLSAGAPFYLCGRLLGHGERTRSPVGMSEVVCGFFHFASGIQLAGADLAGCAGSVRLAGCGGWIGLCKASISPAGKSSV